MPPNSSAHRPDPARQQATSPPAARGLARPRLIPGGYDIARLPLAVPPAPGETLASWLVRWARRYRLPVSGLLPELDAGLPAAPAGRVERHLRRHADLITAAAGLPRLPPGALPCSPAGAMTAEVARYLAAYHGGRAPVAARARYCPACLEESGGVWLTEWAAPLALVCTGHNVLLARRCPSCRRGRFTTAAWMTHDTDPWVCREAAPGRHTPRTRYDICGQDLRRVPATGVDPATTDLQLWWRSLTAAAAACPDQARTACGFATTGRDLLDAALELVVEGLGGTDHLTRPDRSPEALLTALGTAREILAAPDAATAAETAGRHGLLHPAGPITPIGPDHALTDRPHNPLLAAIRLTSLAECLPPGRQLVFRTGSGHPRYPAPPRPGSEVGVAPGGPRLAWIPQLLWPGTLTPWIADHDYRDRAGASMLLAKVGSTRPWHLIATDLGLPAGFAVHPPNLVRHLKHARVWPEVLARLDQLAATLEAAPPAIDYQARRWAAADQALLVAAVNHTRLILGPVHGWVSTHLLVELFWQVYTGGDLRLAAPTEGTLLDPDLYHHHEDEGEVVHLDPLADPDLRGFLCAVAAHVAAATDHDPNHPEPLTWQPP